MFREWVEWLKTIPRERLENANKLIGYAAEKVSKIPRNSFEKQCLRMLIMGECYVNIIKYLEGKISYREAEAKIKNVLEKYGLEGV